MALTKTAYAASDGRRTYIYLSGSAAEVLQAIADEKVKPRQIVKMADDLTLAVYTR